MRYTDAVSERCRDLVGLDLCSDYNLVDDNLSTNRMRSTTYLDRQGTWTPSQLGGVWAFTLGANNILDENPPFCFSCALNSFDGSTYDVAGVFWYASRRGALRKGTMTDHAGMLPESLRTRW